MAACACFWRLIPPGSAALTKVPRPWAMFTAPPRITLLGDRAEALAYSYVARRRNGEWFLYRAAINRWQLVRTPAGWRIENRTNRLLEGTEDSYAVMREGSAV